MPNLCFGFSGDVLDVFLQFTNTAGLPCLAVLAVLGLCLSGQILSCSYKFDFNPVLKHEFAIARQYFIFKCSSVFH